MPREAPVEGQLELHLVIERASADFGPLKLEVTLPQGVELLSGELAETIVCGGALRMERVLRVAFEDTPAQDLVVTLTARGPGFGLHGRDVYRFGRPAPSSSAPRLGAPIRLNGRVVARPVLLTPSEASSPAPGTTR